MQSIYKYPIPVKEKHVISLPKDAQIIRVDDVEGLFYLWAIIDTEQEVLEDRFLEFYKTGQPIESPLHELMYLGFCKIFIMQELCLYVFENVTEKARNNVRTTS